MKRLTKSPIPVIRTHANFIFVFGSQASIVMMMVLGLPESCPSRLQGHITRGCILADFDTSQIVDIDISRYGKTS